MDNINKRTRFGGKAVRLLAALLLGCGSLSAQQNLSDCITRALESNYAVKIRRNTARMAENNVNYAPFLPSLDASARQNQTRNEVKTEDAAGEKSTVSGVQTDSYSGGVSLSWRIFDGLDMFASHERLKELEAIGQLSLQQEIEELVVQVCSLYYQVIVQHTRLQAAAYSLRLSNERYEDAQIRYEIGRNSGLDARQAIVDLHADSSAYVRQCEYLKSAYISLNRVMNADLFQEGYVRDTILLGARLSLDRLQQQALGNNLLLIMTRKDQRITELDLKRARALFFPTLDFTTAYNLNRSETPASQTVMNRTHGLSWGFSLQVPLFNKLQTRTRVRNARLERENAELTYLETEQALLGDLALLFNAYENNLLVASFEAEGASIAESNLGEALVKFKQGALSGLEFREFQRSYIEAVDRKLTAIYQARMSELSLQLIGGNIRTLFADVMEKNRSL